MDATGARRGAAGTAGTLPLIRRARQRGSALAEFVVVLPIIIGLLMSAVLLGRGLATKTAVMAAARVAAREYAISESTGRARDVAEEELRAAGFDPSRMSLQISNTGWVTVTVSYRLRLPTAGSTLPGVPGEWVIPGRAVFRAG